jgi:hypothetical protein
VVQLYDKETGAPLGAITEEQLQFLADQLEEESPDDQEYYVNEPTLDALGEAGGDPALLALLRTAMGERHEMEIRWARS